MSTPSHRRRHLRSVVIAFVAAFGFGATVLTATASHYHTNCVGHGFVHGDSTTDGSFFSRVETGCSSNYRKCAIYTNGTWRGEEITPNTGTTCNAWSNSFGSYNECNAWAHVYNPDVFSDHVHYAHNYCG